MVSLSPNECRVLGVLVEKAQTTPAQYPMTLNALINGCNQKSNRFPETNLSEDHVLDALDMLRSRELAREVSLTGSRVSKYKHNARDTLNVTTSELVVLTELMLRGPQTIGEIRGRASRMHSLESLDAVRALLDSLMQRESPFVQRVAPAPGSRAERYAQLLCPDLHPIDAAVSLTSLPTRSATSDSSLEVRVAALETEVASIRSIIEALHASARSSS